MTLPYPDSPAITENIGTSIKRIHENLSHLDGTVGALNTKHMVSTNVEMSTRSGLTNISGIGFTPKSVQVWAIERTGNSSSFGSGTEDADACVYEDYSGTMAQSDDYCVYLLQSSDTGIVGAVNSFGDNQATFNWTKLGLPTGSVVDIIYIFFS